MSLRVYLDWDEPFFKGDQIELPCIVTEPITDWNIRVTLEDEYANQVKLASEGIEGGSEDQIEIFEVSGQFDYFTIKIPYDATRCFGRMTQIEIEREDSTGRKVILSKRLDLRDKITDWDTK